MTKRLEWLIYLLLSVLIMTVPVISACATSEYRTFTLKHTTGVDSPYSTKETISFSFEYPSRYRKVMTHAKSNREAPLVVRFASVTGLFSCVRQTDTVFCVNIYWPSGEWRDAHEAADRLISGLTDQGVLRERSSITVSGLPAELLVLYDPKMPETPEERIVFFDFNGRIWDIFIYSGISGTEQAKADFEHIIQTFKILP